MVISGTHAARYRHVDMEAETPVELYGTPRSTRHSADLQRHRRHGGDDHIRGRSLYPRVPISWRLPVVWPGAVYSLDVASSARRACSRSMDTHRDIVLATNLSQGEGYAPDASRRVDFSAAILRRRCARRVARTDAEETEQMFNRLAMSLPTQHATAMEAHNRLMLTKAFDSLRRSRSARYRFRSAQPTQSSGQPAPAY